MDMLGAVGHASRCVKHIPLLQQCTADNKQNTVLSKLTVPIVLQLQGVNDVQ
jgi:hypothetical protein